MPGINLRRGAALVCCFILALPFISAQRISQYATEEMRLLYFGKRYSYLMPHAARTFHNALQFHTSHWNYPHPGTSILLNDFDDDGHGGAIVMPENMIVLGIAPFNYAFSIIPSSERFQWLFSHELTHITLADKANSRDAFWRKVLLGKVSRDEMYPLSAFWSYRTVPRWYAPRWYHEGIACYLETWMSGGLGRALGAYDEMYFRSLVNENKRIYSAVGLETEGSTIDFQMGANAYLYGTRFVTWLSQAYGEQKLKDWYTRTDSGKAFYGSRFKEVYGLSLRDAWDDWRQFEIKFQQENLERIRAFPPNAFHPLQSSLGSVSNVVIDRDTDKLYAAVNHPGKTAYLAEMDLNDGKIRRIAPVRSPLLYSVTYLAYDAREKRLFLSEQNNKMRSLVSVSLETGRRKTLIPYSRTGNLVFNQKDAVLWGVRHDNGYASLVKIPPPYNTVVPMFTTEFGRSLLDLSISNDGQMLSASLTGIRGEQALILFHLDTLEAGIHSFDTVYQLEDNTLTQFSFSLDDRYLIGTSYYTGVSNIWRVSLQTGAFELLSNDEIGLFMPRQTGPDSLFVLRFTRDGMQPGMIPMRVLEDANAIEYLGNKAVERNPELQGYSLPPLTNISLDSLNLTEKAYQPLKEIKLQNAFPDISAFKKTLALGYRLHWSDRIGVSRLSLFLGTSAWSTLPDKQKLHAELSASHFFWHLNASLNKTDFYDFFGPFMRSRAGYSLSLGYRRDYARKSPLKSFLSFGVQHYGDLEVLPEFQEINTPVRSFQRAYAEGGVSLLRKSLGAIEYEAGWQWQGRASTYLSGEQWYPALVSEQSYGWLVPGIRNTSFWLRNSLGHAFGENESAFGAFYFGGFRNNYVDWQEPAQYRKYLSFPGAPIDEIKGKTFIKTLGELNLKPIRIREAGTTWFYPTYLRPSFLGMHLAAQASPDAWYRHIYNAGVQLDLELVLFSYLKTTWSAGYARRFETGRSYGEEWMFSVKLLGN